MNGVYCSIDFKCLFFYRLGLEDLHFIDEMYGNIVSFQMKLVRKRSLDNSCGVLIIQSHIISPPPPPPATIRAIYTLAFAQKKKTNFLKVEISSPMIISCNIEFLWICKLLQFGFHIFKVYKLQFPFFVFFTFLFSFKSLCTDSKSSTE